MTTPKNTETNRPPGFDAALTAYLPGLRRRAWYFTRDHLRTEELVNDTIVEMLSKWEQCRMETFKTWAQIVMLRVSSAQRIAAKADCRQVKPYGFTSTPPSQADHIDLLSVLHDLEKIPHGDIVVRHAMGTELKEIGIEQGVTRGAISYKYRVALKRLRDQAKAQS